MAKKRGGSRRSSRTRGRSHSRPSEVQYDGRLSRTVTVVVPLPVTRRVRSVSYTYPNQIIRSNRVIRRPLRPLPVRYAMRRVRVVLPHHLPVVRGSYVSIDRYGRLNTHSRRQLEKILIMENNRRRYLEGKRRHRSGRDGQLESPGSTHLGIVAEAVRRNLSPEAIQDAAMVARALAKPRR